MNRYMIDHCKKSTNLPVFTHIKNISYTSVVFKSLIKYVFAITGTTFSGCSKDNLVQTVIP
jgi:hypothetical protein